MSAFLHWFVVIPLFGAILFLIMSKRFIDTEIFNDSWFMDLSVNAKLLYIYLITNCDHAGIIDINWKLVEFQTGIKQLAKSYETLNKEFGNRLIKLRNGYYFIPKFIEFQYPNFPNSNVRQQAGAIKRLIEFNLFDEENLTVSKELGNSYEYEDEYVNDNVTVNIKKEEQEKKFKDEVENFCNYPSYLLKEFFEYWSEKNKSGSKMRFELEKTWDLKRRLARWSANSKIKASPQKKKNSPEVERMISENYKDVKYIGRPNEKAR